MAVKRIGNVNINYTIPEAQTTMWDALGRTTGEQQATGSNDNFFTKRAKSIENAVGTTLAVPASFLYDNSENKKTDQLRKDNKNRMNEIAKKYGYNTWDDWQDGFQAAKDAGDTAKVSAMQEQLKEFQDQANANAEATKSKADAYTDYRNNNYISQKINQDRGKFAGSAINTLSTALDLTGLTANPIANAIQGGVEGIADELEQNGLENFDLGRAGQNALIGAATGAVTEAFNKGVSNQLAKNGGNLFKGGNSLTKGLNNLGSKTAIGRVGSTLATGAARGAMSGAVGGATGAGLSSVLQGADIGTGISNALQGAVQGAKSGALTGATMAGANMAISKTPGVGKFYNELQSTKQRWDQSGSNFDERLTNTLTSGDSAVGDWLMGKRQSKILNAAGNIGNSVRPTDPYYRDLKTQMFTTKEGTEIPLSIRNWETPEEVWRNFVESPEGARYKNETFIGASEISAPQAEPEYAGDQQTKFFITKEGSEVPLTVKSWETPEEVWRDFVNSPEGSSYKNETLDNSYTRKGAQQYYDKQRQLNNALKQNNVSMEDIPADIKRLYDDGYITAGEMVTLSQKNNTPTTAKGWLKKASQRIIEDANNRGVGLSIKDVSNESPETETYRTFSNNTNNQWDSIAQESGYATYNDVVRAFMKANPNAKVSTESVLDWLDNSQPEPIIATNKTSKENKLRSAAGLKLQKQYGTIDKPTAKATNAPETLQKISDAGFTKPADVEKMADIITGSNGEVSKLVSNLVATADPVNTFNGETDSQTLDDFIDIAIQKRGLDGINEGKAVKSQINALMKSLPSHMEGSVTFTDNAPDVFKLTQLLDSEAANYEGRSGLNYGTTTPDKLRAAQVIKDVSNLMKDRIYDTVDVKQALTPEVAQNLKSYAPNNKAWSDYVDNEIMTATNVKDLRSAQAPWVRARKIIDNGYMNSITYGGRNGGSSTLPLTKRGLTAAVLDATVNSKPGLRLQAKVLNKAADIVAGGSPNTTTAQTPASAVGQTAIDDSASPGGIGDSTSAKRSGTPVSEPTTATNSTSDNPSTQIYNISARRSGTPVSTATATNTANNTVYNPSTQIYNAIGRNEGLNNGEQMRTANYLADAVQNENDVANTNITTLEGLVSPTSTTSTSAYNSVYGGSTPAQTSFVQNSYFQPTGDYWTDILGKAMSAAIDADDVEAFGALYGMYQDALSSLQKTSSSETKLTDRQRQANAAALALDDFETVEPNAAYDVSDIPIIGAIANLGGNEYASKAEALALQLGYMLSGATVNREEAKNIGMAYVPQPRDNAAVRKSKLDQIRGIISEYQKTYAD